jgi:hypothetical protein
MTCIPYVVSTVQYIFYVDDFYICIAYIKVVVVEFFIGFSAHKQHYFLSLLLITIQSAFVQIKKKKKKKKYLFFGKVFPGVLEVAFETGQLLGELLKIWEQVKINIESFSCHISML